MLTYRENDFERLKLFLNVGRESNIILMIISNILSVISDIKRELQSRIKYRYQMTVIRYYAPQIWIVLNYYFEFSSNIELYLQNEQSLSVYR